MDIGTKDQAIECIRYYEEAGARRDTNETAEGYFGEGARDRRDEVRGAEAELFAAIVRWAPPGERYPAARCRGVTYIADRSEQGRDRIIRVMDSGIVNLDCPPPWPRPSRPFWITF